MFNYNQHFPRYLRRVPLHRWPIPDHVTMTNSGTEAGMEAGIDPLDEVRLQSLLQEQMPDNRLPSIPELLEALRNPMRAKPGLKEYLSRRPGLAAFLRECIC